MKPSLHAQASSVAVMSSQAKQRGNLKLVPKQWEMLEPQLQAATITLTLLQSWRSRLPKEFLAEIEGGA